MRKMKNKRFITYRKALVFGLIITLTLGCERDFTDDVKVATFGTEGDIFTDSPIGMGEDFYFPYGDSNFEAASFDGTEVFEGNTSIEVNVPNADNPNGAYAGAILRIDGAGRDLSGFDALTFYAKASQGVTLDAIGFGEDFGENKYQATVTDISLGTGWAKYIIPIPDPSKLIQERGMLRYATGTQNTGGFGYTFWIDEIRFEKLGTLAQPRPRILNGSTITENVFLGSTIQITGLTYTANLPSGNNLTVAAAPSYYNFESSDTTVATVSELGVITVLGEGTTTVTATMGNEEAEGTLILTSVGAFPSAPIPTRDAANVVSLFSDAYSNVPVRHYNGFFLPFQTTEGGAGSDPNNVDLQVPLTDGSFDNIINYTSLNFVSFGMYETVSLVDVSAMTHIHIDINVRESIESSDFIRLSLESGTGVGAITSGDFVLNSSTLSNVDENGWTSVDIPLSSFFGFSDPANLGQLFFISDATISNIWVDNVYFYNE